MGSDRGGNRAREPIVVTIDSREPLAGTVGHAGTEAHFEGWMELLASLEGAIDDDAAALDP